jgi:uncharacterized protein DUF1761
VSQLGNVPEEVFMTVQVSTPASTVRLNYWAILVAAIACFLFEAGWYTVFMMSWLDGIGRTVKWLESAAGYNPPLQYGTALIGAAMMATTISWVTQRTGVQTALRGVLVGALLWLGLILPNCAVEYAFEERPLSLLGINGGFWLLGMMLMGAIVGVWKKK